MSATTELRDMLDAHGIDVMVHRPMTKAELARENRELRELVRHLYEYRQTYFKTGIYPTDHGVTERLMRELGVEGVEGDE